MTGDPTLDRILADVRPGRTVTDAETVSRGNRKRTVVVRFANGEPVVVQRAPDPVAVHTEARLLAEIAGRTAVPVARPLASGTCDGEGYLVTPLVGGRDLHEAFIEFGPGTRRRLAETFGRYLADLHETFRFDGYGPLVADDGGLATTPDDRAGTERRPGPDATAGRRPATAEGWRDWLGAFGERHVERLPAAFDRLRAALLDALADLPARAPTPRLFPWDLRPGNALVADGTVSAVLDWERPLAAGPALSLAKTDYLVADWYVPGEADDLREALRTGYESVRPLPEVERAHRVAAVASAAVDSRGEVTNPRYPPVDRASAVAFHLDSLRRLL